MVANGIDVRYIKQLYEHFPCYSLKSRTKQKIPLEAIYIGVYKARAYILFDHHIYMYYVVYTIRRQYICTHRIYIYNQKYNTCEYITFIERPSFLCIYSCWLPVWPSFIQIYIISVCVCVWMFVCKLLEISPWRAYDVTETQNMMSKLEHQHWVRWRQRRQQRRLRWESSNVMLRCSVCCPVCILVRARFIYL